LDVTRSRLGAASSPHSVSLAHLRFDLHCHDQTVHQSAQLDGRHCWYDRRLRDDQSVCSLAFGPAGRSFNGRYDRQFDEHCTVAAGHSGNNPAADCGRHRAIKRFLPSHHWLFRGLRWGRRGRLVARRLGLAMSSRAGWRGVGERSQIGYPAMHSNMACMTATRQRRAGATSEPRINHLAHIALFLPFSCNQRPQNPTSPCKAVTLEVVAKKEKTGTVYRINN
jgi:hypothetical protein